VVGELEAALAEAKRSVTRHKARADAAVREAGELEEALSSQRTMVARLQRQLAAASAASASHTTMPGIAERAMGGQLPGWIAALQPQLQHAAGIGDLGPALVALQQRHDMLAGLVRQQEAKSLTAQAQLRDVQAQVRCRK
jgi:hypothetical protein